MPLLLPLRGQEACGELYWVIPQQIYFFSSHILPVDANEFKWIEHVSTPVAHKEIRQMESLTRRRIAGTTMLAWLAILGFDFFLHGGVLAWLYARPDQFLLPPEQAFTLIPLGYLSFLVLTIMLVWLLICLEIQGWNAGWSFG